MEYAEQKMSAKPLTLFERTKIAWRYSRELEHSDPNLNKMEELMNEHEAAEFENLMELLLSY
jgi:lysine-N-methylase